MLATEREKREREGRAKYCSLWALNVRVCLFVCLCVRDTEERERETTQHKTHFGEKLTTDSYINEKKKKRY